MLGSQIVEDTIEDHLSKEELISRADFTRYSTLLLDDVFAGGEPESTKSPLATFEFVEMHDAVGGLDLLLHCSNVGLNELLGGVLVVQGGKLGVVVERVGKKSGFENFNFLGWEANIVIRWAVST